MRFLGDGGNIGTRVGEIKRVHVVCRRPEGNRPGAAPAPPGSARFRPVQAATLLLRAQALSLGGATCPRGRKRATPAKKLVIKGDGMRRPGLWLGGIALMVPALIFACDSTEPPVATTISVSPASANLAALGDVLQLTASVADQNGEPLADAPVTWASSDNAVATVNSSGLVTAAGNGSAGVTASSGGASGTAAVTVAQELVRLDLSPSADTLVSLGATVQLNARPLDANDNVIAGVSVEWGSADESVATVDSGGLVTAIANGDTDITATAEAFSATAAVTVDQRPASVDVSPATDTLLAIGDTVRLTAEPFDANGHAVANASVAWSSADQAVATVDSSGLVTATGNGSAAIAAAAGEAAGAATVTVSQVIVAMDVVPSATTLFSLGDTVRLAASGVDANGHVVAGLSFAWTSEHPTVATVDPNGLVTAVRTGSTDVYATSGELRDSAGVTVAQLASEVRVTPAVDTLGAVGDTVRLTAVALDRNGNEVEDTDYIWWAPHPSVVTVDRNGLVTATGVGTGEIRVRATRAGADYIGTARITVLRAAADGGQNANKL